MRWLGATAHASSGALMKRPSEACHHDQYVYGFIGEHVMKHYFANDCMFAVMIGHHEPAACACTPIDGRIIGRTKGCMQVVQPNAPDTLKKRSNDHVGLGIRT